MSTRCPRSRVCLVLLAAIATSCSLEPRANLAWAAEPGPADGCVVTVAAPADAKLEVDGRNYGAKRTITFRPLAPGQAYRPHFVVHFADGGRADRFVRIARGQRIELDMSEPSFIVVALSGPGFKGPIELLRMNPDGTGQKWLSRGVWDAEPRISPDGQQIVFCRRKTRDGPPELFLMPSGGGEPVRLCDGSWASWSSDGSLLAFVSSSKSSDGKTLDTLGVISIASRSVRRLVDSTVPFCKGCPSMACWSPDGTKIAFIRGKGYSRDSSPGGPPVVKLDSTQQVHIVDVRTGQTRQITSNPEWAFDSLAWSPDGRRLACIVRTPWGKPGDGFRPISGYVGWLDPDTGQFRKLDSGYAPVFCLPDGRLVFGWEKDDGVGMISSEGGPRKKVDSSSDKEEASSADLSEDAALTALSPDGLAAICLRQTYDFSDESKPKMAVDLCTIQLDRPGKPRVLLHRDGWAAGADWR